MTDEHAKEIAERLRLSVGTGTPIDVADLVDLVVKLHDDIQSIKASLSGLSFMSAGIRPVHKVDQLSDAGKTIYDDARRQMDEMVDLVGRSFKPDLERAWALHKRYPKDRMILSRLNVLEQEYQHRVRQACMPYVEILKCELPPLVVVENGEIRWVPRDELQPARVEQETEA